MAKITQTEKTIEYTVVLDEEEMAMLTLLTGRCKTDGELGRKMYDMYSLFYNTDASKNADISMGVFGSSHDSPSYYFRRKNG